MTSVEESRLGSAVGYNVFAGGLRTAIRSDVCWTLILCSLAVACGAYSVSRGVDLVWDLQNYHLYNPFAAYHDRYMLDVAPAQIQSYFNPLLDYPFYAAIQLFNDRPRLVAFLMGAVQGFNLLAVTMVAWHCLGAIGIVSSGQSSGLPWGTRATLAFVALAIGATGAGTMPLIGSTTGDLTAAVPIMIGVYFLLRGVDAASTSPQAAVRDLMLAGALAGFGIGSKLTMASYGVAMVAALIVLPLRFLSRALLRFAAAGIVGFLLSGGYHHLRMLWLFGNPLFPMMNHVFKSPLADEAAYMDTRYLPETVFGMASYPFQWAIQNVHGIVSELPFRDIRIALVMSLGLVAIAVGGLNYLAGRRVGRILPRSIQALAIFGFVAYVVWALRFSIYRYLLPLEMLSGVFIVLVLGALLAGRAILTTLVACAALACFVTTAPLEWGHRPFGDKYVEVSAPPLPPDTMVILVDSAPVAHVIPFMGADTVWVSVNSNFLRPGLTNLMFKRARDAIFAHDKGRLMVLKTGVESDATVSSILGAFDLAADNGDCKTVRSNLSPGPQPFQLCRVVALPKA
jgi:hypothetical protein